MNVCTFPEPHLDVMYGPWSIRGYKPAHEWALYAILASINELLRHLNKVDVEIRTHTCHDG
jgi:hypothetical protein